MNPKNSTTKNCRSFHSRNCFAWLVIVATIWMPLTTWAEDQVSAKQFPSIALADHFSCIDARQDVDLGCGFLLKHRNRIYAVSAKHILGALKLKNPNIAGVDHVCLEGPLRALTLFSKQNPAETVALGKLLNEDRNGNLNSRQSTKEDWLVFEITTNVSHVQPLELRNTPMQPGEKLFVVGWTNGQTNGPQRTYEFEYYKTIGTRILLKDVIVPAKLGGLSGSPVVDESGRVVALVSNGTVDPDTGKKMFSPCLLTGLAAFLDKPPAKK